MMLLDDRTSQSRGTALRPATHRERHEVHVTLLIASFIWILAGCGESKEAFNERHGIKGRLDEQGNLVVQSKAQTFSIQFPGDSVPRKEHTKDVTLAIPTEYKPELSHGAIYFNIRLPYMEPWDVQPPFYPELELDIKAAFPAKSLSDPKTRKEYEELRQNARMNKRVRLDLMKPVFSTERLRKQDYRLRPKFVLETERGELRTINDAHSPYLRDGEVAGLQRLSYMQCYEPSQLTLSAEDPKDTTYLRRLAALKVKEADDPTPDNCRLFRYEAIYISPLDGAAQDSVFIRCGEVLDLLEIRSGMHPSV